MILLFAINEKMQTITGGVVERAVSLMEYIVYCGTSVGQEAMYDVMAQCKADIERVIADWAASGTKRPPTAREITKAIPHHDMTTIQRTIKLMVDLGLVVEESSTKYNGRGRPTNVYALAAD